MGKMAEGSVEASLSLSLNEAAIKRFDPYVEKILDVAKYVAVYYFEEKSWKKTEIEGSFFVYVRSGEPFYNILVLNRLNKNNLVESITPQVDIELQVPFLLFRNCKGNILGIWFFDQSECNRLTSLIEKLMAKSTQGSKPQVIAPKEEDGVDIFKMLTKAQEAYSCSIEGKPQSHSKQSPCEMDATPKTVADFFAKAGGAPQTGAAPVKFGKTKTVSELEAGSSTLGPAVTNMKKLTIARPQKSSESVRSPSLHREFTILNSVHSVEHIEKQQRAVTPQSAETVSSKQITARFALTKASLAEELIKASVMKENGLNGMCFPAVTSPPGFAVIGEDKKPDLMPPAMFTPRSLARQPPPEPLTKNQLLQAFDYLLRNDPEFMTKIHEAYVKSLTDKIL